MLVDNNNPITFAMVLVQIYVHLEYPVNNSDILVIDVIQNVFNCNLSIFKDWHENINTNIDDISSDFMHSSSIKHFNILFKT